MNRLFTGLLLVAFLIAPTPPGKVYIPAVSLRSVSEVIEIEDLNDRHILVPPGGEQWYYVPNDEAYLRVSGEGLDGDLGDDLSIQPIYEIDKYQSCWIEVHGAIRFPLFKMGTMVNNATVTYISATSTGPTVSPAKFKTIDMRGTEASVGWQSRWLSAAQTAQPDIGIEFDYGYVQAEGELERCLPPLPDPIGTVCRRDILYQWLVVHEQGTYCQ
jgi:hypothetical protein